MMDLAEKNQLLTQCVTESWAAFPLSIKKSTTSQEVICLMDALRLSVQVTDQKRCFFIPLPALLWDANMTPAQGRRRGGARMRVLLKDLVLFSCLLAFVTGIRDRGCEPAQLAAVL
jgi:hypothetical protein